jgi:hypothetical protein
MTSSQIKKLGAVDIIADFIADNNILFISFFEQMEKENEKASQMIKEIMDEQDTLLLSIFERMDAENEVLFNNLV